MNDRKKDSEAADEGQAPSAAASSRPAAPLQDEWYLTPTHLLEYLYCPRFTYFEHVLGVPERQEKRFKVQKGRAVHEERKRVNPGYLRKKLGVVRRENDVELNCMRLHLRGKVDEILWLDDDTLAPLDYKYAENKGRIYRNQKIQAALYGILLTEVYGGVVNRAFLCYTRSKYEIVQVDLGDDMRKQALEELDRCIDVIRTGTFPRATRWPARCPDCCYRNLCLR